MTMVQIYDIDGFVLGSKRNIMETGLAMGLCKPKRQDVDAVLVVV
jgi:hypothetical protein